MARRLLIVTALAGVASVALAAPAFAADAPAAAAQPADTDTSGDIIVTATKRNEGIRDVPLAISAVTGEQLAKMNANSLSDYIVRLPGVVFNDYQPGVSEVIIRGVSETTYHEQGQTTTGYYINEIPVVEPGWPIGIPDVDTFDLDRVEVLRGPQGTLFGSSTLGGLVNYVVKTADPSGVHAAAEGLVSSTYHTGEPNYAGKLMVNLPIIKDKLAIRVMGVQRYDAGFADNIDTNTKGSNDLRTRGLRGSIVFTPVDGTKLTYLSTYQDTKLDDGTYLSDVKALTRTGIEHNEAQKTSFFLNSLRLDQDLGFATLTAFGSVNEKTNTTIFDVAYLGYLTGHTTGDLAPYSHGHATANIKQGEIRLASSGDGPLKWLIGTSYLRATKYSYDQDIAPGSEAALGSVQAPGDRLYGYISDTLNTDFGVFGEISYRPVKAVEITFGGRYYDNEAKGTVINQHGFVSGSAVDLTGKTDQKEHGFTPKATISVRPAPGFLAYMTYSKGYRIGGINPNAGLLPTLPTTYGSDSVDNYEAGVKFGVLDNKLLFDATVFNIDWHNIQAREFGPGPSYYSYVINAASANIAGVEFSGTAKLDKHISYTSNLTYQTAKLTAFLPYAFAPDGQGFASGTPLPGSSKWSVANNLVFDFPETAFAPTFEIAHRYLSKAPVAFGNPNTRGGFSQFDLRASVSVLEKIRLMAFVNNVFDKRGLLDGPFAASGALYSIIRPRTFGLRVDAGF